MKILYAASEAVPFCKTGGLADVAGSLPEALAAQGAEVAVVLPLSLVSAGVYLCRGAVDLTAAWPYLLGGFAGGLLSGRVFTKVPVGWLRRGFGALLLYGGVRAVLAL